MSQDVSHAPEAAKTDPRRFLFAGFWRRVGAGLIDGVLISVVIFLIVWIDDPTFSLETFADNPDFRLSALAIALSTLMSWLYHAGMEASSHQATLGKKALGLRVTDLNGKRVSLATASLRASPHYIVGIVSVVSHALGIAILESLVMVLVWVSCLVIAFTKCKQGLHDMMAKCYVVRLTPGLGRAT